MLGSELEWCKSRQERKKNEIKNKRNLSKAEISLRIKRIKEVELKKASYK